MIEIWSLTQSWLKLCDQLCVIEKSRVSACTMIKWVENSCWGVVAIVESPNQSRQQ